MINIVRSVNRVFKSYPLFVNTVLENIILITDTRIFENIMLTLVFKTQSDIFIYYVNNIEYLPG